MRIKEKYEPIRFVLQICYHSLKDISVARRILWDADNEATILENSEDCFWTNLAQWSFTQLRNQAQFCGIEVSLSWNVMLDDSVWLQYLIALLTNLDLTMHLSLQWAPSDLSTIIITNAPQVLLSLMILHSYEGYRSLYSINQASGIHNELATVDV